MTQGDAHERAAPRLKPQRIVLIGFMGSGKSTVGKILAARLGWDFVDTDEVVQERTGAPVTRIFE
jgi:shikimate kinase